MENPVAAQPDVGHIHLARPPPGEDGGPVVIRNMTNNDGEFAGRLTVEAFRPKFEHAVGKRRVDGVIRVMSRQHERMTPEKYSRHFIAEYEGKPAGLLALKFHGDKSNEDESGDDNIWRELGCRGTCGLWCMHGVMEEDSSSAGICYLDHICVDSSFRGKGIGKVLMDRAEYEALKMGCQSIFLWVAQDNRAKNLYLRQGYTIARDEDGCCFTMIAVGYRRFYKMSKTLPAISGSAL